MRNLRNRPHTHLMATSAPASAALAAFCSESVPPQDIQQLTSLQGQIHHCLHAANQDLAAYNSFSAEEHARLVGCFAKHAVTLQAVHSKLLAVFRRTRALRARLLAAHPELAEAAAAADAAREAEIERSRAASTVTDNVDAHQGESLLARGASAPEATEGPCNAAAPDAEAAGLQLTTEHLVEGLRVSGEHGEEHEDHGEALSISEPEVGLPAPAPVTDLRASS